MFSCGRAFASLVIPLPSLRKVMTTIMDVGGALSRPLLHYTGRCTCYFSWDLPLVDRVHLLWTPVHCWLASDGLIQGYLLASKQDKLWCNLYSGAPHGIVLRLVRSWDHILARLFLCPFLTQSHFYRLTWESFLTKSLAHELHCNQGTWFTSA